MSAELEHVSQGTVYESVDEEIAMEDLEAYRPGGLAVIDLGNVLYDKYMVVDKLSGGFRSTTWLAQDLTKMRYVALKILAAEISWDTREEDMLQQLEREQMRDMNGRSARTIPGLLDSFSLESPNGQHRVLVLGVMRCSMTDALFGSSNREMPLMTARAVAAQLVLAVESLHARGVVHGDISPNNVLFRAPNIDQLSVKEFREKFPRMEPFPLERNDGQPVGKHGPEFLYTDINWGLECHEIQPRDAQIALADFGSAFNIAHGSPGPPKAPRLLEPPEFHVEPALIGAPADVWTLALTMYMCFRGSGPQFLLRQFPIDYVAALGRPPARWWDAWPERGHWFDNNGAVKLRPRTPVDGAALEERVLVRINGGRRAARQELLPAAELADLLALLRAMLAFEPGERLTAVQVAGSAWMRNWGRQALEVMDRAVGAAELDGDLRLGRADQPR